MPFPLIQYCRLSLNPPFAGLGVGIPFFSGNYAIRLFAIALPRSTKNGRFFGNSFTLQKIEFFLLAKIQREGANIGGEIQRGWRYVADRRDISRAFPVGNKNRCSGYTLHGGLGHSLWGLLLEKTDPIPVVPGWPQFMQGCMRYRQSLDEQTPNDPRTNEP